MDIPGVPAPSHSLHHPLSHLLRQKLSRHHHHPHPRKKKEKETLHLFNMTVFTKRERKKKKTQKQKPNRLLLCKKTVCAA